MNTISFIYVYIHTFLIWLLCVASFNNIAMIKPISSLDLRRCFDLNKSLRSFVKIPFLTIRVKPSDYLQTLGYLIVLKVKIKLPSSYFKVVIVYIKLFQRSKLYKN